MYSCATNNTDNALYHNKMRDGNKVKLLEGVQNQLSIIYVSFASWIVFCPTLVEKYAFLRNTSPTNHWLLPTT